MVAFWQGSCIKSQSRANGSLKLALEDSMLALHVENMNDLAVIECKGRIIHSDAVFKLRDAVQAQRTAHIIALDLSEVDAIGGGGLGMLAFLERWAHQHGIQLKLFNPSRPVLEGLVHNRSILNFEIASFHEMMGILAHADYRYSIAA
jgi:anti-anti-sigma regulatory factor